MLNTSKRLLGQWVVALVLSYFKEQKKENGDKLFTRITGIDDSAWSDVLNAFQEEEERLEAYYRPILRTLTRVEGFERYQCREHETTTWLRNNNAAGEALLIFMNDTTAEAQSLENIFTVDEARLLSSQGLEVLYRLFAETYKCYGEELQTLQKFMDTYNRIAEPQLRNILMFLSAIIKDKQISMIDKIQSNLDQLLLFRDNNLLIKGNEGYIRLKRNYQLSRLEKDGKSSSKDDFIENLYEFIEKNTADENEYHELWQKVNPEIFREQALEFIHNQSTELLKYDYDEVAAALLFRVGKKKLNARMNEFKEIIESQNAWTDERNNLLTDTIEAIDNHPDPDKIQEFLNEFSGEFQEHQKLRKDLERTIVRQRQLSEYSEFSEALLRESILMLEKYAEDLQTEVKLILRVADAIVSEEHEQILKFHLFRLEQLTKFISFDETSLRSTGEKSKQDVSFQLSLYIGKVEIDSSRFKLTQVCSGLLCGMIEGLREKEFIPYVQEYYGPEVRSNNVIDIVKENVSGYVAVEFGSEEVKEAASLFYKFIDFYTEELLLALENGLCGMDFERLEASLKALLEKTHQSSLVTKHIYQYISCLGAYDRYDCKSTEKVGSVQERVVTLLNPIRLLSYSKRISHLKNELAHWLSAQHAAIDVVDEIDTYFQQLQEHTAHLSPHYFAVSGMPDCYLIECQEQMGEGTFVLNGKSSGEEHLVKTFADELLSTVKTYLEVYPYARDCLDIVFLYCSQAEYVKSAIDQILRRTNVRKIKAVVHSETKGALLYEQLNNWIQQEEQFSERHYSFPKVEIRVIAEKSINVLMNIMTQSLHDADIVVLVNYFGGSSNIQYRMDKVGVRDSDNWFDTIYREPLKKDDAIKRVSLVSEKLPKLMQHFYRLQYMLHYGGTVEKDDNYLLRNVIALTKQSDEQLINYMHEQFNWSFIIDRYLDKSLLRQVSSEAQIIKYKSNVGKDKGYRTLVSSSKYIRKLANELSDHEYYDRLHRKFALLLKNDDIDRQIIIKAMERVKDISGGIVLRAIGPGKFAHEMMAIYLATEARPAQEGELVIWSICDELPWFQGAGRRPDLVRTSIRRNGARISLDFELVELKFISHTIFEIERFDAIKQVKAGMELYRSRFKFENHAASAELWRKELIYYLLEYNSYDVQDALLLKDLQGIPISEIDVSFTGAIDTFVYTSNLYELSLMDNNVDGYQTEVLNNEYVNHIYNRNYILKALGAVQETSIPSFETLQEVSDFVTEKLGLEQEGNTANEEVAAPNEELKEILTSELMMETAVTLEVEEKPAMIVQGQAESQISAIKQVTNETIVYPEQAALVGISPIPEPQEEDIASLLESYHRKLRYNFNQIGIQINIVESLVGVSVIRFVVEIPGDKPYSSVENRAKDIYLWLQLSSVPLIALRNGRINIDINRDKPETVYFENFMNRVREQFAEEKLRGKLIAPIGIGQMRELITLDFSSPNTPHLLIGGTTGSGKSVTINSIILALMCLYGPNDVQFIFIDPKKVEFLTYENRCHTKLVITEIEEAIAALEQLVEEMESRYWQFAAESVSSIDQFVEFTGTPMPRLIVVFDEFADFMEREKSLSGRVENAILRLGAKARAAGIHLLICTQNPKADIVPTNIRNNLPARLSLKTADHHASKIIISEEGAEKLAGKGDFLMKVDLPEIVRAKSPFLTSAVKRALLKYFEANQQS
ncbi:FtsK/SpoIIIE domain-containing protein [Paenibacillus alvei]|uniref:FtsK/SpoIIIE domain-containing protein n=1 Tax=Paenibacillus alvei TaxID=44250 RepID=A0ABT4H3W3_PAEAL|nr:FtsK/SpoIIIE domain-containing protein [Paenibacillus alvei]MCY9763666.1 FtsK/SpoIIIE domain-containing protein [Paenibacillus alvei]MCY9768814.1 FtsK/SpoIIIE domain-containing protein [Paenibacillus alvei]